MTAFRILFIYKHIYAYIFFSIHHVYFNRDETLDYLAFSTEVP